MHFILPTIGILTISFIARSITMNWFMGFVKDRPELMWTLVLVDTIPSIITIILTLLFLAH